MSIEKLTFVKVTSPERVLDDVLRVCLASGCFHMENALSVLNERDGYIQAPAESAWDEPLNEVRTLRHAIGASRVSGKPLDLSDREAVSRIRALSAEHAAGVETEQSLERQLRSCEQSVAQLSHMQELNYDLDRLFTLKNVKIRFGHMPAESYEKLARYADDPYVLFLPGSVGKKEVWGCYFAPASREAYADDLFTSLFFERFRLTDEAHGTPQEALARFRQKREELKAALEAQKKENAAFAAERSGEVASLYTRMKTLQKSGELRRDAAFRNEECVVLGWIPKKKADAFCESLAAVDGAVCECDSSSGNLAAPVKLHNNPVFRPFEMFVQMYGVPAEGEADPTPLIAILYSLLFGIMFGDLGQGIFLALAGIFADRVLHVALGKVMTVIGCFSAFFGLLYGSVFGYEHLLDPLYRAIGFAEKPIEVTSGEMRNVILIGAVVLGACILLIAMVANIVNGVRQKNLSKALFSKNGVAGILFYLAVLLAAGMLILFGKNILSPLFILLCCVLPLLLIFFGEALGRLLQHKRMEESAGEYVLQNVFEMIETLLSYLSNTLSFIRVGAFVLSHAYMMSVVFMLADKLTGVGNIVAVIFGNLFVIVLEGLIVGIQVLRLQFFEIFSRFYEGGGREFVPVTIESDS